MASPPCVVDSDWVAEPLVYTTSLSNCGVSFRVDDFPSSNPVCDLDAEHVHLVT